MTISRQLNQGFTLIELMIAMFFSIMVISGIFALFRNQVAIHNTERLMVSMQQNVRAAVSFMERDIRLAGSDPAGTSDAAFQVANESQLTFTTDINEDGVVIPANETVAYTLDGGDLKRGTDIVARNIDALNFDYFDSFGNPISDKGVVPWVVPLNQIARVEVSIIARSGDALPGLFIRRADNKVYRNLSGDIILDKSGGNSDMFRRMQITTDIDCRNIAN